MGRGPREELEEIRASALVQGKSQDCAKM